MGHTIRTKWLNQILKMLKETWIHPCSSVTSFPGSECKLVCVDSSGAQLCSGSSSGPAQKELEPVVSMNTDLGRYPQLVPVWAASHRSISWPERTAGSRTLVLSQAAGVPAVTHGAGLGGIAALFCLGRMDTWIFNSWSESWVPLSNSDSFRM